MSYQAALLAIALTALTVLVIAAVVFLIAVMVRAYRESGTKP